MTDLLAGLQQGYTRHIQAKGCIISDERVRHLCSRSRTKIIRCGYFWVMRRCVSAQTERGNSRGGATKKSKISRTSLPINLYFSVLSGVHFWGRNCVNHALRAASRALRVSRNSCPRNLHRLVHIALGGERYFSCSSQN